MAGPVVGKMPALLTQISKLPKFPLQVSATSARDSESETSALIAITFAPVISETSFEVFSACSKSRSATTTEEPASAKRFTIPAPMPLAPPVTTEHFPLREISSLIEREV